MKVAVWDTYVEREDGRVMHFDILVSSDLNNPEKVFEYGREYLREMQIEVGQLTANKCSFCHIERAPELIRNEITHKGYYIIEMENCG